MKIRICLPIYETISEPTRRGIEECLAHPNLKFDVKVSQGCYISVNRNRLINDGVSMAEHQSPAPDVDYFLCLDSDIGFSVDDVVKLLAREKDLISGAYTRQWDPENLAAGFWKDELFAGEAEFVPARARGLMMVEFTGCGFLLVHRSVFCKMAFPWFHETVVRRDGTANIAGEDLTFCNKAIGYGFSLCLDADVRLKHKGRKVSRFNWDFQGAKAA